MKTQKAKVAEEKAIIELRQQNKSISEIATELMTSAGRVTYVCKKYELGGRRSERKPNYEKVKIGVNATWRNKMEQYAADKVKECGEFEYIGGYTGHDCKAFVRCLKCGEEFAASFQTIRKRHIINCPGCEQRANADKEFEREALRIEQLMASWRKKISVAKKKETAQARRLHRCPNCGKPTYNKACCSSKCQKAYNNRTHYQNRRAKIHDALVDADIELMKLYRRDNGVCHICGGKCDVNDFRYTEDGWFVAGDTYPSIDHVVPLSRGGEHSWLNVKLAHRSCNTKKSNTISPPSCLLAECQSIQPCPFEKRIARDKRELS